MATNPVNIIEDFQARGLIAQQTSGDELVEHLGSGVRTIYCGFDPTADSLHIGSLVPLLALRRFQLAGHKPIALVGGATGLIGDPSFKAQERQLNTPDVVAGWVEALKAQVSRFVDFDCGSNSAEVVNNLDWIGKMDVLSFLRDIGKHFPVNQMIKMESVKQRIEREGEGISYTEFTYMILQSLDFAELYNHHNCTVQIGGSDQWGNITGGTELTRRLYNGRVYGITLPLVTKADGTKFGKTESGTIWLDPAKTSPYAFYQFWLNTADADVYKFLHYFTFLEIAELRAIEEADKNSQGRPEAQGILAREVTKLIHGEEGYQASLRITEALFSGSLEVLSADDFQQLSLDGLPSTHLSRQELKEGTLAQLLVDAEVVSSGKQVKDALGRQAVLINGRPCSFEDNMNLAACFAQDRARHDCFFLLKLGKKKYHLFVIN